MKILLTTILYIICLCQAQNAQAENVSNILVELHDDSIINLSSKFIENPTNYFSPMLIIDFFSVFNKDLYKDKRFTYITNKHPTADSMLGVRLRVNVVVTN